MQTAARDLTTPRARPVYAIDGDRVLEMRSPYDLTLEEFSEVEGLFLQLGACLLVLENPPKGRKEQKALEEIRVSRRRASARICEIALGRPDAFTCVGEIRAVVVCNDFVTLCKPVLGILGAGRAAIPEIPSPSRSSSRTSPASTPAPRRATGRGKRP